MNIAVLGSNCQFSSDLAVQLNKLKQSSLVYRYDVLADFKRDVPLYKSLLKDANKGIHTVDVDFEDEPTPGINTESKKLSAFGEYIGDVETKFLEQPKKEEDIKKFNTLKTIFETLNTKVDNTTTYIMQCLLKKLRENGKNTKQFASNLLNIINIYSGILNIEMLGLLTDFEPLTLIVKVKNNSSFIPCAITDEQLKALAERRPQLIILEVSSINELLNNNFFISTFNLREKRREEPKKVEEKKETPDGNDPVIMHHLGLAHHLLAVQGGAGLVAMAA